jgi:RND family efflux transporter MFP subunit
MPRFVTEGTAPSRSGRSVPAAAIAAILCSAVIAAACQREPPPAVERQETLVAVGAVPAEKAFIRSVVHASGVITPAEGAEFLVVAPEPARIAEVNKADGDPVRSGDLLARFDLPSASQEVARLAADLAAAEAQLENARVNQSRVADFVERGLVPRRDRDIADRERADAQAAVERVRTQHERAVAAAGRAIVRAPFDGVVAGRRHNPGDMVLSTSTDPVLRVVNPRRLEVVAFVGEADVSRVVPGATARITAPISPMPIGLKVARRLAEQEERRQAVPGDRAGPDNSLPFLLAFDNDVQLAVDARVEIDIDAEERASAVLVPIEALIRDGGETVVMVAADSLATRRVVTTGIQDAQRVEITSGVRAGELVITRGHIGLSDGAAISVAVER